MQYLSGAQQLLGCGGQVVRYHQQKERVNAVFGASVVCYHDAIAYHLSTLQYSHCAVAKLKQ
jgi:hypothetical protein